MTLQVRTSDQSIARDHNVAVAHVWSAYFYADAVPMPQSIEQYGT